MAPCFSKALGGRDRLNPTKILEHRNLQEQSCNRPRPVCPAIGALYDEPWSELQWHTPGTRFLYVSYQVICSITAGVDDVTVIHTLNNRLCAGANASIESVFEGTVLGVGVAEVVLRPIDLKVDDLATFNR